MITQENISLVIQLVTLLGIIFGVFTFFRKPTEDLETKDAVFNVRFDALEKLVVNLRDNHIHTLDEKIDKHIADQNISEREVANKLGGIEAKLDFLINK